MEFGVIHGEPIASYHACAAVSRSKLMTFRRSALLFHRKHVLKVCDDDSTAALDFGAAFDRMLLEPELPKLKFRYSTDLPKAEAMRDRIMAKPHLRAIIEKGEKQVTFRKDFGPFAVQCRPDIWLPDGCPETQGRPAVVNLKTTADLGDAQGSEFFWAFRKYGYAACQVFEQEVIAAVTGNPVRPDYLFLASEKCEPYDCGLFRAPAEEIEAERKQIFADLVTLRSCYEDNRWPGIPDSVLEIVDPRAKPKLFLR